MRQVSLGEGTSISQIPESCGRVTVGCTDVAGIVQGVIDSFGHLRAEYVELQGTVRDLDEDQRKVLEATDEARLLSERAIDRLSQGSELIGNSLGQIGNLLELVQTLTQHVTGFAAAMDQVRRSSQEIDQIAETTNILALNATIEAMRAGEQGRTFAVVANEVKSLANETRRATEEIGRTIDTLGGEAAQVIEKIQVGATASAEAKSSVSAIERTLSGVTELIGEVDQQQDLIARNSATISEHVHRVQDVLGDFDSAVSDNEAKLATAHDRMEELELTASEMFDTLVKAGLSPQDSQMVEKAQGIAQELVDIATKALAEGTLTMDQLFDQNYREVPGTDPKLYRTNFSDWADKHWRPVNDAVTAEGGAIVMCTQADMNGFLPTHITDRSRKPIGDLAHDTKYCRNGRIIMEGIDNVAKTTNDPFTMAVYRQEGDGKNYVIVRDVYVPLIINGRRWGDVELAYSFD
ncbi:methyl-accepting chemotaxis protein [Qipengyuania sp. XHP0207]|uniref:methyl-accepting chemotaxis protein n=1 Tax=Qipengyuania sp. XHP0207 TaxID=3038078 RepID=UPI00241F7C6A|nr:methyl-accepting chemotaxis protein [Qipengyuania sp. XHP0207]MDG5749377.1 methyl-accepting chemotaxis protein [Qipengyuania sp. XHP0207]